MSKQITPIAPGRLELRYQGQLVGYAVDQAEAQARLSEIAYDAERGRALPIVEAPSAPSAYPLPPAALIAQLLSYPEYRMRNDRIAYVAAGPYPDADPRPGCTQIYLDGPEAGRGSPAFYVPLLYHHAGELWVSTSDQRSTDPECSDIPQRVLSVNPIPCTDLVNIVAADELFTMRRRDVERQIGAVAPTVRMERQDIDEYDMHAWCFKVGDGKWQDGMVELCLPDETEAHNNPRLYLLGHEERPADVERMLPNLIALLNDPQVIAARRRAELRLPALPVV